MKAQAHCHSLATRQSFLADSSSGISGTLTLTHTNLKFRGYLLHYPFTICFVNDIASHISATSDYLKVLSTKFSIWGGGGGGGGGGLHLAGINFSYFMQFLNFILIKRISIIFAHIKFSVLGPSH